MLTLVRKPDLAHIFKAMSLPSSISLGGPATVCEGNTVNDSSALPNAVGPFSFLCYHLIYNLIYVLILLQDTAVHCLGAFPAVQPLRAALHFDSAAGFGPWRVLVGQGAITDLRRADTSIKHIFVKKIKYEFPFNVYEAFFSYSTLQRAFTWTFFG